MPRGLIPNGPTVQGVYCLMPDGTHLSGFFAWAHKDRTERIIQQGWENYLAIAKQRNIQAKPIPDTRPDFTGGKTIEPGGVKLQVTSRDLPRGNDTKPGRNHAERSAYNINWFDLSPREARAFVAENNQRQAIPAKLAQGLALRTLRDNVRGQVSDWRQNDLRKTELFTQRINQQDNLITSSITGQVHLGGANRSFVGELRGRVVFDASTQRVKSFELIAVGQRTGRTQFNGRQHDLGPAPMGVALTMHPVTASK